MSLLNQIQIAQRNAGEAAVIAHLASLGLSNVGNKKDPYASEAETAALLVPDTRTPAEKRLQQLIEAESVPELCGSDYSQALYKAALKMAGQPTGKAPCERHCEANAFQIMIRGLKGEIERIKAAPPAPVQEPVAKFTRWGEKGTSGEGYTVEFLGDRPLPPDGTMFYTAAQPVPPENPMLWRLPCDVRAGGHSIGKGCTLQGLVSWLQLITKLDPDLQKIPENCGTGHCSCVECLKTTGRTPLTMAQRLQILNQWIDRDGTGSELIEMVEAAHDIKEPS